MAWQDIELDGTIPGRSGARPLAGKPLNPYKLARPLPPCSRPVMAQVGWMGQTGAVYRLDDEPRDGREPGSYRPLYVQIGEWVDADGKMIIRE
jgi:hypothetical protein